MRIALSLAAVLGLALLAPGVPVVLAGCCPDSESSHIVLTFATGFTYSADVTFTTHTSCGGCSYQAPTSGPFTVNNPADTCVALPDAGAE